MMVRRRPRSVKLTATTTEVINNTMAVQNGDSNHLLDEQYFASPKRKDCKIENTLDTTLDRKTNSAKSRQERAAERIIGVPLATRSQTRTIENFFKASAKLKANNITKDLCVENELEHNAEGACYYDLCGDDTTNDTDNTECSDEAQLPLHLPFDIPLNHNHNHNNNNEIDCEFKLYDTCENIFLQAPVLKLNVDETVRHIPISKGLELEPVFSSPSTLNGRFNKIVSLNAQQVNLLPDNDNSSCDSGVAFSACSMGNNSPPHTAAHIITSPLPVSVLNNAHLNRRRKPTTPHRIVCPSPVKSMSVLISPLANKIVNGHAIVSPRKSQRQTVELPEKLNTTTVGNNKTRRRLNQHYPQQIQQQLTAKSVVQNTATKDNKEEIAQVLVKIEIDSDDEVKPNEIQKEQLTVKQERDNQEDVSSTSIVVEAAASTAKSEYKQPEEVAIKTEKEQITSQHIKTTSKPATKVVVKKIIKTEPGKSSGNRELSEFFPVRRSVRKTKSAVKEEMLRTLEQAILEERNDGLRVEYFEGKGRGVLTTRAFLRGEFVVEYVGDLISMTEAAKREQKYALDENAGCYMYYFKHKNQQYCIDATADTGKLGRLINHSRNGNLMTKVVVVKQRPHLILIAKDNIAEGEELCYDYGDRSKESLLHHPWLAY